MKKSTIYLDENFIAKMDSYITESNIKSRSDLIEQAVDFFIDYNRNKEAGKFLSSEVEAIMTGELDLVEKRLGNRFGKLLSDTAIQMGILAQIMENSLELKRDEISKYRKIAVDEIKSNQRIFRYEDLAK